MKINIIMLPIDMFFYISKFLSPSDKKHVRETCSEFNLAINLMDVRIEIFDSKIDNILDGRNYILGRLRLAALCGLNNYSVAEIWSWVTFENDTNKDVLPFLRQIGSAIYKDNRHVK